MSQVPDDPIAAVTHSNPYRFYADLVARAPLVRHDGLGFWVAASAEVVTAVLTSPLCGVRPLAEPVPRPLLGSPAGQIFRDLVRMNDGPRHPNLKKAVAMTLGSLDARETAEVSREWAPRLAAELTPAAFAFRLPIYTVGSLLGVPGDQLPLLAQWIGDFVAAVAPGNSPERVERGRESAGFLLDLFRSLPAEGRGLLPTLAREARSVGESEDAILANGIGFLFQAHDATAGLIGNTILALAARPEIRQQAASDPGLLRPVLLEVLRFDPPVQNTRRFVLRDGLVAGREMKEGEAILVILAAASRDPAIQVDPDRFDPFREDRRSFTFGLGPHACPGETLAVTIAQAGIESLLSAGIDFEGLAGNVAYRPSANARIPLFGGIPGHPSGAEPK